MVKLTQVDDETDIHVEKTSTTAPAASFSDSDSDSDSDFEDDFDIENETIYDRIVALKDIVPPSQRKQIFFATESLKSLTSTALSKGGNLLWMLTSSALLLGVPLSLSILAETQLQEMEKDISLQQSAQDVLAPGVEGAYAEKATA